MAPSSYLQNRNFKNFPIYWINIFLFVCFVFSEIHEEQNIKSIFTKFEKCGNIQKDKTRKVMKELEKERLAETRMVGYHYELLSDFSHCLISRVDVKKCSLIYRPSSQLVTTKLFIRKNTALLDQMKKQFIEKLVKDGVEEYSRKIKYQKTIANQSCQVQKYLEEVMILRAKNQRLNASLSMMGEKLIEFQFENDKLRTTTMCPTTTANIQLMNEAQDNRIKNKILLKTLIEKDNLIENYQKQLTKLSKMVQSQRVLLRFYSTILNTNKKIGGLKRIKDKIEMAKILKTCLPFMLHSNEQEYKIDNEYTGIINDVQSEKELYYLTKTLVSTSSSTGILFDNTTVKHLSAVKTPPLSSTNKIDQNKVSTSKYRSKIVFSQKSEMEPSFKKLSTPKTTSFKISAKKPSKSYISTKIPLKKPSKSYHISTNTPLSSPINKTDQNKESTSKYRTKIVINQKSKVKPFSKKLSKPKSIPSKIPPKKSSKSYYKPTKKPIRLKTLSIHSSHRTTTEQHFYFSTINISSTLGTTERVTENTTYATDVSNTHGINSTLPTPSRTLRSTSIENTSTTCTSTTTFSTTYESTFSTSCVSDLTSTLSSTSTSLNGVSTTDTLTSIEDITMTTFSISFSTYESSFSTTSVSETTSFMSSTSLTGDSTTVTSTETTEISTTISSTVSSATDYYY